MSETLQAVPEQLDLNTEALSAMPFTELAIATADFFGGDKTESHGSSRKIKGLILNEQGKSWRAIEISSTTKADEFSDDGSVVVTHQVSRNRSLSGAPHQKLQWGIIIPRNDPSNMKCFYSGYMSFAQNNLPEELYNPEPRDLALMKSLLIEGIQRSRDVEEISLPHASQMAGILALLPKEEPEPKSA